MSASPFNGMHAPGNGSTTPATSHFRFRPCYALGDLTTSSDTYTPLYLHHFFTKQVLHKTHWPPDYLVNIFYIPSTLDLYVEEEGMVPVNPEAGATAPPPGSWVVDKLRNVEGYEYPGGFLDKEEFVELLTKYELARSPEMIVPEGQEGIEHQKLTGKRLPLVDLPGTILARCSTKSDGYVWLAECTMPVEADEKDGGFPMLHRRIEWFMHFYIDALSRIELDSRWRLFLVIRFTDAGKRDPVEIMRNDILKSAATTSATGEHNQYQLIPNHEVLNQIIRKATHPLEIVGMITVYQFFSLPRDRARVSQFFMFPPWQRRGVGRTVLHALLEIFAADPNIRQYIVEDPASAFIRLRDVVCCDRAIERGLFSPDVFKYCQDPGAIPWEKHPANRSSGEWEKYSKVLKEQLLENGFERERIQLLLSLAYNIPQTILESCVAADRSGLGDTIGPATISPEGHVGKRRRTIQQESSSKAVASSSPVELLSTKQGWGRIGSSMLVTWAATNPQVSAIRVRQKRKLRMESLEWYTQPRMGLSDVHSGLEDEWREIFLSLCSSIYRLRSLYR